MKKIFFIATLIVCLFASCTHDDEPQYVATYRCFNIVDISFADDTAPEDQEFYGSLISSMSLMQEITTGDYDARVFQYNFRYWVACVSDNLIEQQYNVYDWDDERIGTLFLTLDLTETDILHVGFEFVEKKTKLHIYANLIYEYDRDL